jgi:outer membrane murein-binding lipoprotein Lpp
MAITTGMAIAAGVSAASSLAGGAIAGKASKKAARVQEEASKRADAAQERRYQEQLALQEPFRQGGLTAQDQIMQLLGIGGDKTAAGYGSLAKSFDELYGGDNSSKTPAISSA